MQPSPSYVYKHGFSTCISIMLLYHHTSYIPKSCLGQKVVGRCTTSCFPFHVHLHYLPFIMLFYNLGNHAYWLHYFHTLNRILEPISCTFLVQTYDRVFLISTFMHNIFILYFIHVHIFYVHSSSCTFTHSSTMFVFQSCMNHT